MAQQQRPLPRTRSSTGLSSSSMPSSLPGSPGPSVSVRGNTPTATPSLRPLASRTTSMNSSSASSARPRHARDRSTSNFSVATSSGSTRTAGHHNRRQQTLMGGNPNSKLSRSHLATYNSSTAMDRSKSGMTSPPVPDILINGAERPEDVDIASIGRLPSLSAANPVRSSPEATSIGVDGLFAKFGVKEVRSIAQRGRARAESKREELRTMVGERYRDLLGAADSIVRMRRSSTVLLDRLARARQECDREAMVSKAAEEDMTRSHMLSRAATPLVSGHTPYSVATLVKLLLDCPEHIWRCIERQDYLSAARLDSIGRAVYRELVSAGKRKATPARTRRRPPMAQEDDEDSGGYDSDEEEDDASDLLAAFPLVEQQFDTLDGLAPQISSRASLHLRAWEVSSSNVADSLATLLMLDRISIADGLDLLLEQRSTTLSSLFQPITPSTTSALRRPSALPTVTAVPQAPQLSPAASQSPDSKAMGEAVQRTIEALSLILVTHEHIIQCFGYGVAEEEPRLLHLLRLLQQSTSTSADSPNTTLSVIQPQGSSSTYHSESLQPILSTLPNAHLFLRYLPEQILTFTPYIDIESADSRLSDSTVQGKLEAWFEQASKTFADGIAKLFNGLTTASQLAEARTAIRDAASRRADLCGIDLSKQISSLHGTLDEALGTRFIEIFTHELENITRIVPEVLEGALRALPSSQEDLKPVDFVFSASLPFPTSSIFPSTSTHLSTMTTIGKLMTADPFTVFKRAMDDRISGRPPVLSECLRQLESVAAETKTDMLAWLAGTGDSKAREAYTAAAREVLAVIERILRETLDKQEQVPEQLLIGSVAVHLAMDSTFVQALLLLPDSRDLPNDDKTNLLEVEKASKRHWRETSVKKAAEFLRTSLLDQLYFPPPENPSRPAGSVFDSLSFLLDAVNELGLHRAQAVPSGIEMLLQSYEQALVEEVFDAELLEQVKAVDKAQRSAHIRQIQSNIALLREVLAAGLSESESAQASKWSTIETDLNATLDGDITTTGKGRDAFLRSQNLFAPLLASSRYYYTAQHASGTASMLLPMGTPPAASASEGMLDLAKPGPRLALLPVNATAA